MSISDNILALTEKRAKITGSSDARSRIAALLDEGSFMETGAFVKQRPTELTPAPDVSAEAVVTGFGTVNGVPVYVFSQDISAMGGALSEMHAQKILALYDLAAKTGSPVVGIFDSKGARIAEGVDALNGYAKLIAASERLSGVVPQVAVICGICGGAAAMFANTFDFVIMKEGAELFITSPQVVKANGGKEETGTAKAAAESGLVSLTTADDATALALAARVLSYLPENNAEGGNFDPSNDPAGREADIVSLIAAGSDARAILASIADNGQYLELGSAFGKNILTAFARFDGQSVGVVANLGTITKCSANKAAKFISICDAFNLPIVTLADTDGFAVSDSFEGNGGIRAASSLASAYACASVPKVTVVAGKAIGSGYIAMGPKGLGADMVLAWPNAEISALSVEAAVTMLYNDKLAKSKDPANDREKLYAEFRETIASPYEAAKRGYVDDIINPNMTRPMVIYSLGLLSAKREPKLPRKHGGRLI